MSVFKLQDATDLIDPAIQKMFLKRRPETEEEQNENNERHNNKENQEEKHEHRNERNNNYERNNPRRAPPRHTGGYRRSSGRFRSHSDRR